MGFKSQAVQVNVNLLLDGNLIVLMLFQYLAMGSRWEVRHVM